ncbi:type VI secretion system protein ImpK [Paucimonas lemoignei]|uniref:Type VI secretion system protein ImpK n=1 Tax=Paucimonas lemoignei TaxID=29443 RepID=A0A4R3I1Q9_PAULE|nr:type IVB secretion system protein IcmH/DotU [Paucimonas lemoignei]TCS39482.1 type VI secretion system protein ImpK [Paucimonas lemoignei]
MKVNTIAPSLYAESTQLRQDANSANRTLVDMLHDGFYLLLLLKNRYVPNDAAQFAAQVRRLLDGFERNARQKNVSVDDIYAAKYAFCAAVDETILSSESPIRDEWERSPLQLILFGDQLAGEHFYSELETVRHRGAASVETLEVFYMCLLTGFQGKYMLESKEKLNYLIATLDKEIAHLKGKRAQFAPHWKSPDSIKNMIRHEIPAWIIGAAFALFGVAIYAGLSWYLADHTNSTLGTYYDIVKLAPKVANITISLP